MKDLIQAVCCAIVVLVGLVFIAYSIADLIQFHRAMLRAINDGRIEEWLDQPNRMRSGSGFRLFKKFHKR